MTRKQIETEHAYRIQERLGILCGSNEPTPEQLTLATREAEIWESRFLLNRIVHGDGADVSKKVLR